MTCLTCKTIRNKITGEIQEMLAKFVGEDTRKAFYIQNIKRNHEQYKAGQVPFEWAGFVYHTTREEFLFYFQEDIDYYLESEIIDNFKKYSFNPDHGNLWSLISKKLSGR